MRRKYTPAGGRVPYFRRVMPLAPWAYDASGPSLANRPDHPLYNIDIPDERNDGVVVQMLIYIAIT